MFSTSLFRMKIIPERIFRLRERDFFRVWSFLFGCSDFLERAEISMLWRLLRSDFGLFFSLERLDWHYVTLFFANSSISRRNRCNRSEHYSLEIFTFRVISLLLLRHFKAVSMEILNFLAITRSFPLLLSPIHLH